MRRDPKAKIRAAYLKTFLAAGVWLLPVASNSCESSIVCTSAACRVLGEVATADKKYLLIADGDSRRLVLTHSGSSSQIGLDVMPDYADTRLFPLGDRSSLVVIEDHYLETYDDEPIYTWKVFSKDGLVKVISSQTPIVATQVGSTIRLQFNSRIEIYKLEIEPDHGDNPLPTKDAALANPRPR